MRLTLRIAATAAALSAALLVSACGSSDNSTVDVVVIGDNDAPFESGARLSLAGQLAYASTTEGLVAFDNEGRVIPALADRWIVTNDGLSYIFRLRGGTWENGSEITAKSAQSALIQAIQALRGTSLGLDLAGIDEIRAMAGRVIEIRLSRPMPYLLQLLAQPELGLRFKRVTAGPMRLKRAGDSAKLQPIKPEELGLPAIEKWNERVRTLRLSALPGKDAVDRFNRGEADFVLGGSIEDFPLTSSVGILRGTIQTDPVTGLFGLAVMNGKGFLEKPGNREAIAMAINRDKLIAPFNVSGWKPTTRIVAPGLDGDTGTIGERWVGLSIEARRRQAAARVAQWRQEQRKEGPVRLRIALPQGRGSDLLFIQLRKDFQSIGLEAVRAQGNGEADLRLIDDVARYPHAAWFLNRLNCKTQRGLCDKTADNRVAEAQTAQTPAARAELLAQAEAALTVSNVFIPFGPPIRWSLVRGDAKGFSPNPWGWHPLMPMALLPT